MGEEKFESVFNASSNAMAFTEADSGKIVDVNEAWVRLTGIGREQAIGESALELGVWVDSARREACLAELRAKGGISDFEAKLRLRGEERSILFSAAFVEVSERGHIVWDLRDITERRRIEAELEANLRKAERSRLAVLSVLEDAKRAEEGLSASKAFLDRIIDLSPVPMWISDERGILLRSNAALRDASTLRRNKLPADTTSSMTTTCASMV